MRTFPAAPAAAAAGCCCGCPCGACCATGCRTAAACCGNGFSCAWNTAGTADGAAAAAAAAVPAEEEGADWKSENSDIWSAGCGGAEEALSAGGDALGGAWGGAGSEKSSRSTAGAAAGAGAAAAAAAAFAAPVPAFCRRGTALVVADVEEDAADDARPARPVPPAGAPLVFFGDVLEEPPSPPFLWLQRTDKKTHEGGGGEIRVGSRRRSRERQVGRWGSQTRCWRS